jgi:hypothetical protein
MTRVTFGALIAILLTACVTTSTLDKVRYGMTESEVTALIGPPESSTHSPGNNCSTYVITKDFWSRTPWSLSDRYSVCYVDGKVERFGKIDQPEVKTSQRW